MKLPPVIRPTRTRRHLLMSVAMVLFCFLPAFAQEGDLTPPKAEMRLTVGASGFTSDQEEFRTASAERRYVFT